ncbi:hypothetical protein KFE25_011264 [Diacronema lutheri]|uniref:Uncharacterized protein n=1 Tax=Diacronema lutheri TaxID=2081491 RepID=A0A8J5X4B0_DIALT|nr:hypothetical protein KFE25_011264 [Diacronema lutheri]
MDPREVDAARLSLLEAEVDSHRAWLDERGVRPATAAADGGARGAEGSGALREAAVAFAQRLRDAQRASGTLGAGPRAALEAVAVDARDGEGEGDEPGGYDAYARRYSGCAAPGLGDESGRTLERLGRYAQEVQAKKERRDATCAPLDSRRASFASLGGAAASAERAARAATALRRTSPEIAAAARAGGARTATPPRARARSPSAVVHRSGVVHRLETWAHGRAARLSAALDASPTYAHSPTLDARSMRLVGAMRGRSGPIETQLLAEADRRRREFDAQAAAQLRHALASARPAISARARALEREGDVAERLHAYGELYEHRRAQRAHALRDEQRAASVHARATDGSGGARVDGGSAYAAVRVASAVERLTATAGGGVRARRASTGELREWGERPTFAPAIDERSRALAAALGESAADRLLRPSRAALRRAAEAEREALAAAGDEGAALALLRAHELRELRECSFAPRVHAASARLAEAKRGALAHAAAALSGRDAAPADRFETLHLEAKARAHAVSRLKERFERQAVIECSFAPATLENGGMAAAKAGAARRPRRASSADASRLGYVKTAPGSDGSVVRRLGQWARRREQRRELTRGEVEQREMAECTFRPRVPPPPSATAVGASAADGGAAATEPLSVRSAVSVSKWLLRQSAGRARQEERRDVPHATGASWTRASTVPDEFAFATDGPSRDARRCAIREALHALQPPIVCSVGEAAVARGALDTARADELGGLVQLAPRSPRSVR